MSQVNFDFSNKNIVVTGASSGMGRQIALELAQAGAQVLGIARGELALQEVQTQYPEQISIAPCDVTDSKALEDAIANFVVKHGKLSGSVHAAGIMGLTPVKSFDLAFAQSIMATSFWAGINLVKTVSKVKYSSGDVSHVLFSSVYGHEGTKGMFAYSGAKAALLTATRSCAKELAHKKQRVNTLSPGWVKSKMTDEASTLSDTSGIVERHLLGGGHPEDVSGMVLFLLSDRARWITGADFVVDGGFLA